MFELEVQGVRRIRLRVGRLHFRTWRSAVMRLPKDCRSPESVHAVETLDADGNSEGQIGAFFSEAAAEACLAQLERAGHTNAVINLIPVHSRLEDWEFDR